jgi:hypothetical protein
MTPLLWVSPQVRNQQHGKPSALTTAVACNKGIWAGSVDGAAGACVPLACQPPECRLLWRSNSNTHLLAGSTAGACVLRELLGDPASSLGGNLAGNSPSSLASKHGR